MEKRRRIFVAINLPQDIKNQLARREDKWKDLPARWTQKDQLHITLEFLGYLNDIETAEVCKKTAEVAESQEIFSVSLNKIIYAPPGKIPPKMIWATGEKSKELSLLKSNLQKSLLEAVRFKPEERDFSPHVTLSRINEWEFKTMDQDEIPEVDEDINLAFTVESIEVMESELKRGGPVYTVLQSCSFKE